MQPFSCTINWCDQPDDVGAPLTVWRDADHKRKDIVGEVLEADAPRRLVYTFSEHVEHRARDPDFDRLVERFGTVLSEDEPGRAAGEALDFDER